MTKSLNQKAFTVVEGLLTIIALSLIVFIGYYVYNTGKKTDETYSQASHSANSTPSKKLPKDKNKNQTVANDVSLQSYLVKTCSSGDRAAIDAMFANKATQTTDTDNYMIEGNYAISNVSCKLANGGELYTEFAKFSSGQWDLVVKGATSVSCDFLTKQGFPDKLKAAYCQNTVQFE